MNTEELRQYRKIIDDRREQLGVNNVYLRPLPEDLPNAGVGLYRPSPVPPRGLRLPRGYEKPPRGLIRLAKEDVDEALRGADKLRADALRLGAREKYGVKPEEGKKKQRIGAFGEIAVSRAFGVRWDPQSGTFGRKRDVMGWEVRTRDGISELCLQPEIKDLLAPFILVQRITPWLLNLAGWIWGVDGHQMPWYGGKDGSEEGIYRVPDDWLLDPSSVEPARRWEYDGSPRAERGTHYRTEIAAL